MKAFVIAKAHLQMLTSKVRAFRGAFLLIITLLLVFWGFFIAPALISSLVPEMEFLGVLLLPYVGGLIDFIFALVFAFFIMYQLSSAFQNLEEGQHELLLATPTKEGDIFLGEYLGRAPIYAWGILFLVPLITSLLQNLFGITPLDVLVITLLVIWLIAIAAWIGSIITGFVLKRVTRSARGKDVGKAFTMIIAIIFVAGFYGFMFMSQDVISNPAVRAWLQILPSSWIANIVNAIIGSPIILPWFTSTWSLIAISSFSIFLFYGGYRLAPHFYSLDIGGTQTQISIEGEHAFFRFLRDIIPRNWGALVVTNLKNFVRRKENLSKLAYAIVIVVIFLVIQNVSGGDMTGSGFSDLYPLLMTPWMFAMLLGTILGSFIFVQSKDVLWVYKQSPRGIKAHVQGNLIAMIALSLPLAIGVCVFLIISTQLDALQSIALALAMVFNTIGSLSMTIGISSLNPVYKERSGKLGLNSIAYIGIQMFVFFAIIVWFINSMSEFGDVISQLILNTLIMSFLELGLGIPLLYIGIWRLQKIE